MVEFNFVEIYKRGFIEFNIPLEMINLIKKEAQQMIDANFEGLSRWNRNVVGSMEHEYHYAGSDKLLPYLRQACQAYTKQWANFDKFDNLLLKRNYNYTFNRDENKSAVWINFQKKHEYNPIHIHNGFLSFVLWVSIPYSREEEQDSPRLRHTDNQYVKSSVADFRFYMPDHLSPGGILNHTIPVDKSFEGKMIVFDASLFHTVNPFYTSDDYRISISGNLDMVN